MEMRPERWLDDLLRPLLIAGMVVCLAAPATAALGWLFAPWEGTLFLGLVFVGSLEGILSERILQKRRISGWEYLASRGAELLVLLLLLRLANLVAASPAGILSELRSIVTDPRRWVTSLDLATMGLFLPLWLGSLSAARMSRELDASEARGRPPADKTSAAYYLWQTSPPRIQNRMEAVSEMASYYLWGGILLLVSTAVAHKLLPGWRAPGLPILLYFGLGLSLLCQARFSATRATWEMRDVPVQAGLSRRYLLWAALFLLAVALASLLLPTWSDGAAFRTLRWLLLLFLRALGYLSTWLLFLLALPLRLLSPARRQSAGDSPPTFEMPPPEAALGGGGAEWVEDLMRAVLWLVALAVILFAVARFARDRLGPAGRSRGHRPAAWRRLWAWLRMQFRRWRHGLAVRAAAGRRDKPGPPPSLPPGARLPSLGRLAPRQLVWYFYLSAARRAAAAGQARAPGQTPYEYRSSLDERFSELEPDLADLTDAFVRARYSPDSVAREEAERLKPPWQRIKTALRRRRPRATS